MRYWWVNQNQTFAQETQGGYLWSPKRKADGKRNPFYEFMREVAPGDVIFSFANTRIPAIGIAQSTAYEAPKPAEFGAAGPTWSAIGWRVAVHFHNLTNKIKPSQHLEKIGHLMPEKYAPLQQDGRGMQAMYLTEISERFATELAWLIGREARGLLGANAINDEAAAPSFDPIPDVIEWEDHISNQIQEDSSLDETQRSSIVMARRGQGKFKANVQRIEKRCRITGVDKPEHLIASHSKPWRDCDTNDERLDGENGLLLTPSIDHLFDRGYISFEGAGELLISPVANREALNRMGVTTARRMNVGTFSDGQRQYLDYHRERIFLKSNI